MTLKEVYEAFRLFFELHIHLLLPNKVRIWYTFAAWVARYEPKKRQLLSLCFAAELNRHHLTDFVSENKLIRAFMKKEAEQGPLNNTDKQSRIIQGISNEMLVFLGPRIASITSLLASPDGLQGRRFVLGGLDLTIYFTAGMNST